MEATTSYQGSIRAFPKEISQSELSLLKARRQGYEGIPSTREGHAATICLKTSFYLAASGALLLMRAEDFRPQD
jgi:hypothetical protein